MRIDGIAIGRESADKISLHLDRVHQIGEELSVEEFIEAIRGNLSVELLVSGERVFVNCADTPCMTTNADLNREFGDRNLFFAVLQESPRSYLFCDDPEDGMHCHLIFPDYDAAAEAAAGLLNPIIY